MTDVQIAEKSFFKFLRRRQKNILFYTKTDVEMTTAKRAEMLLKNT